MSSKDEENLLGKTKFPLVWTSNRNSPILCICLLKRISLACINIKTASRKSISTSETQFKDKILLQEDFGTRYLLAKLFLEVFTRVGKQLDSNSLKYKCCTMGSINFRAVVSQNIQSIFKTAYIL